MHQCNLAQSYWYGRASILEKCKSQGRILSLPLVQDTKVNAQMTDLAWSRFFNCKSWTTLIEI